MERIITKLPDSLDPSIILEKRINELNRVCPFCGGEKTENFSCDEWFGKKNEYSVFAWLKIWEKNHRWKVNYYRCLSCGAAWKSEPFPTDITGIKPD